MGLTRVMTGALLAGCDAETVSPAVTSPESAGLVWGLSADATCPRATKASSMLHTVISDNVFFISAFLPYRER